MNTLPRNVRKIVSDNFKSEMELKLVDTLADNRVMHWWRCHQRLDSGNDFSIFFR